MILLSDLPNAIRETHFAEKDPVRAAFGGWLMPCGNPCIVTHNGGGSLYVFEKAAEEIRRTKRLLVIDGSCVSACALVADKVRKQVCITEKAVFAFHQGYTSQPGVRFDPPQSLDIDTWVKMRGGYPKDGLLEMPYEDAKKFWRTC